MNKKLIAEDEWDNTSLFAEAAGGEFAGESAEDLD